MISTISFKNIQENTYSPTFIQKVQNYFLKIGVTLTQLFKRIFCINNSQSYEDLSLKCNHLSSRNNELEINNSLLEIENHILDKTIEKLNNRVEKKCHKSKLTMCEKIFIELSLLPLTLTFFPFYIMSLPLVLIREGVYEAYKREKIHKESENN